MRTVHYSSTAHNPTEHEINPNERRLKIFWIDHHDLLNLALGWAEYGFYAKPLATNVPRDARILSVVHDFSRDAFGFLISHPSFPDIGPGASVPWIDRICFDIIKQPDTVTADDEVRPYLEV